MALALAAAAGICIGVSLGALGGGGSILTVPALVYLVRIPAHAAVGASLIVVGITAGAGVVAHARTGRVRIGSGALFGLLGVAGSLLGARLSAAVSPQRLLAAFAVLMLVAAVAMFLRSRRRSRAAPVPEPAPTARPRLAWALRVVAAATGVGLVTGFFGVGGGFVVVPALVLALGYPMPTAVGTSLLVIAINSAAALVGRVGTGIVVNWPVVGLFTTLAIAGTLVGTQVAGRVRPPVLARGFVVLLVGVSGYMLAQSLPAVL